MKTILDRGQEAKEVTSITVEIANNRFRISETVDGRLKINKIALDRDDDYMRIHPSSGNEIDLS